MGESCEVCGRQRGDLHGWFAALTGPHPAPSTICGRGFINIATDLECYRLGYERSQEALAAARRECAGLRDLVRQARYWFTAAAMPVKAVREPLIKKLDEALAEALAAPAASPATLEAWEKRLQRAAEVNDPNEGEP